MMEFHISLSVEIVFDMQKQGAGKEKAEQHVAIRLLY